MKKVLAVLALIGIAAAAWPLHAAEKAMSKAEVEGVVKQYLADHPEVIMDAMKKYQEKMHAEMETKAAENLKMHKKDLAADQNTPIAGNPHGDVTMVEFFDYHCGYCKKMVPEVAQLLKDDPKLKVAFKEFPILSPDSDTAARASLAFAHLEPEKYFEYHTALMGMSGKFEEDALVAEAKKLGADPDKMKKEMNSDWVKDEIKKNHQLAEMLAIRGTPAFIIGDTLVPGAAPVDDLKKAIQTARNGGKDEHKKQKGS